MNSAKKFVKIRLNNGLPNLYEAPTKIALQLKEAPVRISPRLEQIFRIQPRIPNTKKRRP